MKLTKLVALAVVALLVSVTAYSVGEGSWECLWDDATCDAEFQHLWGSSTGGMEHLWGSSDADRWEKLWGETDQTWFQSWEYTGCALETGVPPTSVNVTGGQLNCDNTWLPPDGIHVLNVNSVVSPASQFVINYGPALHFAEDKVYIEVYWLFGAASYGSYELFKTVNRDTSPPLGHYPIVKFFREVDPANNYILLYCGPGVYSSPYVIGGPTDYILFQLDLDQRISQPQTLRIYRWTGALEATLTCTSAAANQMGGIAQGIMNAGAYVGHNWYTDAMTVTNNYDVIGAP